ncbi:hypothetical protein BDN72DRAFT_868943 [Pluteus cervinus]|uniref:Uncharacterized protein n=1 Tax=Pluteus cervinus TaxID=181527 RepID=A0ACD3B7C8_9AGAR|nr:hypothetical protein BDN72DRAFT_868943 [Pluteus cervinus]
MYNLATPYPDIRDMRPGLTSFAAQVTLRKLTTEAEAAVDSKSGLHMALTKKTLEINTVEWADIGSQTPERVQQVLKTNQPLTWSLLMCLAARPPRTRDGVKVERIKRAPEIVVTGVLSTLNFSRTSHANLLPLATGLLFMGSGVSWDVFRHTSRFGITPAYASVLRALTALSDNQAMLTRSHGRDVNTIGRLGTDNIQNYLLQRDPGIGRENQLNIGLAATYYEVEGVDASVFDLDSKREHLRQAKRKNLTVDELFNLIDARHLETVGSLQWLSALISHIPELEQMKPLIATRYKTDAAKHRLPAVPTKVHPLATSSHSESTLPELKAALADFLEQSGQSKDLPKPRLFPIGGDGLTFEKLVQLKEMLQFHDTPFDSFEFVEPLLEWWHTMWTDLSRIFETYWGNIVQPTNPASLGHSAKKIGRKQPANLKKVDFYPNSQLAYLILDARLLDCWRLHFKQDNLEGLRTHFRTIAQAGKIPTFDELEKLARGLFRTYTTVRARHQVMKGTLSTNSVLPVGQLYPRPFPTEAMQVEHFKGDEVLAQSMAAMTGLIWSREIALATADGDPGRIWEVMKMKVFTFAGSAHTNYTNYLLEMITRLEFESSPDLRNALLHLTLINLTGKPGHFAAGDFVQEYFNRLLEAVVQHKGVKYGDKFIRDTWSRNLHHMAQLKSHWLDGSKTEAETRILVQLYADEKLHSFRSGRKLEDGEPFVDDFEKGIQKLQDGKLQKWTRQTTYYRDLRMKAQQMASGQGSSSSILEPDVTEHDQEEAEAERQRDLGNVVELDDANEPTTESFGLVKSVDGELIFCDMDVEGDASEILREGWELEDEGDFEDIG